MPSGSVQPMLDQARSVADAVLYEGYLLYPYRKSSPKNRVRWQFGVLAPRRWIEAQGVGPPTVAGSRESWYQQTECLVDIGPACRLAVAVRFLQLENTLVEKLDADGRFSMVEELTVAGDRHLTFEGAVAHEHPILLSGDEIGGRPKFEEIEISSQCSTEYLIEDGQVLGRITRWRRDLRASVEITVTAVTGTPGLSKLSVRISNRGDDVHPEAMRREALASCLVACHTLMAIEDGAFISLLDPPRWAVHAAQSCGNVGAFPVLVGPAGTDSTVLSSPIILYDYPRVAPESPGDLFDAGEIDEILSLRTLTLTDDEKAEVRATDRRAAEIIDRVESLPDEVFSRLHGAVRSLQPSRSGGGLPAPGSKVTLLPRGRGADAQDMFLAGRIATVESVITDVDGSHFLAVTIDGDPRAEVDAGPGRLRHFRLEEVELR